MGDTDPDTAKTGGIRAWKFFAVKLAILSVMALILSPYLSSRGLNAERLLGKLKHKPALILFHSEYCAPCQIELKMLPAIKLAFPGLQIAVVTLTKPNEVMRNDLKTLDIQLIDASYADASALLRSFNDKQVALPFSLAVDADGKTCAERTGLLGMDIIKNWRQTCSL
jgi:thiol-disulfide isomerase/thioredoxin